MQPLGLLAWIVIGALAGWLAGMAMKSRGGLLTDIVVGIIGGFLGGFLFNALGLAGVAGFNLWSIPVAFAGAALLLGAIHLVNGRRRPNIFN